jgi:hypothetical protein
MTWLLLSIGQLLLACCQLLLLVYVRRATSPARIVLISGLTAAEHDRRRARRA